MRAQAPWWSAISQVKLAALSGIQPTLRLGSVFALAVQTGNRRRVQFTHGPCPGAPITSDPSVDHLLFSVDQTPCPESRQVLADLCPVQDRGPISDQRNVIRWIRSRVSMTLWTMVCQFSRPVRRGSQGFRIGIRSFPARYCLCPRE